MGATSKKPVHHANLRGAILHLRRAGWESSLNIARALAISQSYVVGVCREAGLSFPHGGRRASVNLATRKQTAIVDLYRRGTPLAEIQQRVGATSVQVNAVLQNAGVTRTRRARITDTQRQQIIDLYQAGASYAAIRAAAGVSKKTITAVAREADLPLRGRGRQAKNRS